MSKEKYIGESALNDKPSKKLTLVIKDGSVTTPKIADESVKTSKMADNSVTSEKIVDSSITWDKLSEEVKGSMEGGLGINLTTVKGKTYDNKILARIDVPKIFRKKGLIITYVLNGKWVTEQYQGFGNNTDAWEDDNLWNLIASANAFLPINTKDIYDDFMQKTQREINNELASHVTMTDMSLELKFDENTGDVYGETSSTSVFTKAEQKDDGDIILTINK